MIKRLQQFNESIEPNSLAFIWFGIGLFSGAMFICGVVLFATYLTR